MKYELVGVFMACSIVACDFSANGTWNWRHWHGLVWEGVLCSAKLVTLPFPNVQCAVLTAHRLGVMSIVAAKFLHSY